MHLVQVLCMLQCLKVTHQQVHAVHGSLRAEGSGGAGASALCSPPFSLSLASLLLALVLHAQVHLGVFIAVLNDGVLSAPAVKVKCRAQPLRRSAESFPQPLPVLQLPGSPLSPGLIVPLHFEVDAVKALKWTEFEWPEHSEVVLDVQLVKSPD